MSRKGNALGGLLENFSYHATKATGTSFAFICAAGVIVVWAVSGPLFGFSDTWQLVINTGTTIATFLMVFLIQRAQNKDANATHLKLNEIVAALKGASNRLIDVEDMSEDEIAALRKYYRKLIVLAAKEDNLTNTHSIEEATTRHGTKHKKRPSKGTKSARSKKVRVMRKPTN
jgi:low affinity Fe/Cu permease